MTEFVEAVCGRCGERFIPHSEEDREHDQRADGEPCGGQGDVAGAWNSPEARP